MQHLQPNTTLQGGKYRIERVLGQGGFGNTYMGYNTEFEETVAIKEFFMKGVTERDEMTSVVSVSNADNVQQFEEQREKFKKEALRIRKLDNPHIVKVYDLFEENGTAYYVMDFVEGENLSQRLKRTGKPMGEQKVREILPQILDALKAVHDADMWHLDLKPANIMLDKDGCIKLIDFGASKQLNAQKGGATTSTAISYTNGYAPREQMEQNYDKFGPWTDIYALGATLYNLLTNKRPPMPSDIDDDISEDKHNALPFPATTSTEMKKLVVQMMQTNRMKRPQTIGEISLPPMKKIKNNVESEETTLLISPNRKSDEETIIAQTFNEETIVEEKKKQPLQEKPVTSTTINQQVSINDDNESNIGRNFIIIGVVAAVLLLLYFGFNGTDNSEVGATTSNMVSQQEASINNVENDNSEMRSDNKLAEAIQRANSEGAFILSNNNQVYYLKDKMPSAGFNNTSSGCAHIYIYNVNNDATTKVNIRLPSGDDELQYEIDSYAVTGNRITFILYERGRNGYGVSNFSIEVAQYNTQTNQWRNIADGCAGAEFIEANSKIRLKFAEITNYDEVVSAADYQYSYTFKEISL